MIEGEWKADGMDTTGSGTWTVQLSEGDQILNVDVSGGSPMNLCYSLAPVPSKYFFLVDWLESSSRSSSLSVGVVRPSEFKKGWGTKGMFYNGNLTNGGAALKVGYGSHHLKEGDSVLLEYTELAEKFQLKVHVNGTYLGTGFEIPKNNGSEDSFVPCVQVQGGVRVRANVLSERPAEIIPSSEIHPLLGNWTLVQAFEAPQGTFIWPPLDHEPTSGRPVTATVHLEPLAGNGSPEEKWMLVLKVCNTMKIIRQLRVEDGSSERGDSVFALTPLEGAPTGVMSTMMMPPPPFGEIESKLSKALASDWKKLRLETMSSVRVLSGSGELLGSLERQERDYTSVACTSYQ